MYPAVFALIDCILRSTAIENDRLNLQRVTGLLSELVGCDEAAGEVFGERHTWEEVCRLRDFAVQACLASDATAAWESLLRNILTLGGQAEALGCLRQAVHTVLQLRPLQAQFTASLESEKREVVYHFAYGLSHELNNPLANIASRAGLLLQSTSHPEQVQLLNTIVDSAMRGSEMLGDLMLTARPPKLQLALVELEELRKAFLERGQRWAGLRNVKLELIWQAAGTCQLDRSMLSEIVWSVLRNAIEASAAGSLVTIKVERRGNVLEVQIDDEGQGLSQQALQHCFDPYFSGREAGRGLGMGLAKAKRLALLHGGDVVLGNRCGVGCRASIRVTTH